MEGNGDGEKGEGEQEGNDDDSSSDFSITDSEMQEQSADMEHFEWFEELVEPNTEPEKGEELEALGKRIHCTSTSQNQARAGIGSGDPHCALGRPW